MPNACSLREEGRAGTDLAGVNIAVGLAEAVPKLVGEASCSDGLHGKAGVPQL